ncbi:helix-turn-helix domain-containing protein [Tellurirhabdus rosea]|uniref:helix-turn-helix domain-containing protein n=1 Tax=Tellurirhabdus rosea TaxID=2674997 RepID=UPI00225AD146|nr:helix-turn-helix domain-containing protein [Tellurirhabdus rosea]
MSSKIRLTRICQYCGKQFEARTTVTRCCSDQCAKRFYKVKKREGKVEASNEETKAIIQRPIEELKGKDFLSIQDACKLLGVSRWTLWRAINNQTLLAAKVGRRTLIRRTDIDRLFETPIPLQRQEATQPEPALEDCYGLTELREKFNVSDKTLYSLIKRHNIPKYRRGKFLYIAKSDIEPLLDS